MEHGMNCPHHADKDEACTCALTERTMHAAWRKRAEEAETRIAALEAQVKALTEERDAAIVELCNIAYAKPFKWDADQRCPSCPCAFQNWAQSRARAAVEGGSK